MKIDQRTAVFAVIIICLVWTSPETEALQASGFGNLGQVSRAALQPGSFQNAVMHVPPAPCANSTDEQVMAEMARRLRHDVRYINPRVCNIVEASAAEVHQLTGTGTINSKFGGMATAHMISSDDFPDFNGRLLVTNAHAFQNRSKVLARIDRAGRLIDGPFRIYLEACRAEYEVEKFNILNRDFNQNSANDMAFAILKEPVCPAAQAYKPTIPDTSLLSDLTRPRSFSLVTRQLDGDICQRKKKDPSLFTEDTNDTRGPTSTKLFVSRGALVGVGPNGFPDDPLVGINMDLLSGGSGGALFSNYGTSSQKLIGLAVGDGSSKSENLGILFTTKNLGQLSDFLQKVRQ